MSALDGLAKVLAIHADYVANRVRHCTCGWKDDGYWAQYSRQDFAQHLVDVIDDHITTGEQDK